MIVAETRIVKQFNTTERVRKIRQLIVYYLPQALGHSVIEKVRNNDFSVDVEHVPLVESPFCFKTFLMDDGVIDFVGGRVDSKPLQFLFLPFSENDVSMRTVMPISIRILLRYRKFELNQLSWD